MKKKKNHSEYTFTVILKYVIFLMSIEKYKKYNIARC